MVYKELYSEAEIKKAKSIVSYFATNKSNSSISLQDGFDIMQAKFVLIETEAYHKLQGIEDLRTDNAALVKEIKRLVNIIEEHIDASSYHLKRIDELTRRVNELTE